MMASDGRVLCGTGRGAMDRYLPYIVTAAAVAISVGRTGMDAVLIVLGYCAPAVVGARMVQALYHKWQHADGRAAGNCAPNALHLKLLGFCAVAGSLLVFVKKHEGSEPDLDQNMWTLLRMLGSATLTAVLLAVAFELSGTPKAELADTLRDNKISYMEGAARLYFWGYLVKSFGDNGNVRFADRMNDFLLSERVGMQERDNTSTKKMFILLPMVRTAILSDRNLEDNDETVKKEKALSPAATDGERKYSEVNVYTVTKDGCRYRLAMEGATPMRTALCAVDDADADFDDYNTFASQFHTTLQDILKERPLIGSQLELVPIYEANKLGETVVERFLQLKRQTGPANEQMAVASREPEEGSELDNASLR